MRISCPSCQSSYKIADEKVQGRTVKVRCRKCGMTIHVNDQGVMNDDAGAAFQPEGGGSPGVDAAPQFSVLVAEGDQRDMGLNEVVAAYNSGVVTADTFVWSEGQPDWMPLKEISAIVEALNVASAAVDKAATGEPTQETADVPDVEPAPSPSPGPAQDAAQGFAARPAEPASTPLFGGVGGAIESAMPSSAASATPLFGGSPTAAVQQSHEDKADLFSTQAIVGMEDDVATSAPRMDPINRPIGARDESSVLFSLSALTSATAATSSGDQVGGEDSGLIDLRALADKGGGNGAQQAAPVVPSTGGILDAAPLLGAPLIDPSFQQLKGSEPPPPTKNMGMIIGIAVGAIGILSALGVLLFVLTREPAPAPVPTMTAPTMTEPTVATTAPATPVTAPPADTGSSAAAAPATGAPSEPPEATTTKSRTTRSGGTRGTTRGSKTPPKTTGGGTPTPPKTTSEPKKAPPPSKCNCPPGDLACNMACAVK